MTNKHNTPPALSAHDALLLDFDGTLVPLAAQPDAIDVSAILISTLRARVHDLNGAAAIISGRPVAELKDYLPIADISLAGVHGAELSLPPHEHTLQLSRAIAPHVVLRLQSALTDWPGVLLEQKRSACAIHFRQAPQLQDQVLALAQDIAQGSGLELLPGKCVVELRQPGRDKGQALKTLMNEPPFQDRRPIMLGDDTTDEAAFIAAQSYGGWGIKVGDGDSQAHYRLDDPMAVLRWLRQPPVMPVTKQVA